jgi:glycosyltransferase involved in cell wall biosynthesis
MLKHDADGPAGAVDVLLLSTYDTDGAGKFTHQLAESLQNLGFSTRVVCVRKRSGDENTVGILDHSPFGRILYRLGEEVDRRLVRPRAEYAFIHLRALADHAVLASGVWPRSCRLIICTFLSGMLSPSALLALRSRYGNPPVVFYGVDMNFYTAGCHYARDCTGYLRDCSDCPAVPGFARAMVRRAFLAKQNGYRNLGGYVIVASSHEHHEQIARSTLFGQSDIRRMLMAVDHERFGGYEERRSALRGDYGFSGTRVLLLRSSSEPRKGCDMFLNAVRWLLANRPRVLDCVTIVAIGDHYVAEGLQGCKVRLHSPGYIGSDEELARLYAIADVFLNTSLADGGPVMLAQALMSGTPVITTDVGLARDLVCPPLNGRILVGATPADLATAVAELVGAPDSELQGMRQEARRLALERVGKEGYLRKLDTLVKELIGGR